MIDITKQITYWRDSAAEDWEMAIDLSNRGKNRYGLFFLHLSFEKLLKAHVCKKTKDLAPRIHNLVRLSELASMNFEKDTLDLLADLNEFHIEGRYPDLQYPVISRTETFKYLEQAKEVYLWLSNQLLIP